MTETCTFSLADEVFDTTVEDIKSSLVVVLVIVATVVDTRSPVASVVARVLGEDLTGFAFVVLVGVSLIAGSVTISFFIGDFSVVTFTSVDLFSAVLFERTGVSETKKNI